MDGQMDGRINGWVDGWMGGWVDRWMDGWVVELINSDLGRRRKHRKAKAIKASTFL
jgi:hypothetical protein